MKCNMCGDDKPEDQFYRNRALPGGRQHHCKVCAKLINRAYRRNDDEAMKQILMYKAKIRSPRKPSIKCEYHCKTCGYGYDTKEGAIECCAAKEGGYAQTD